MNQRFVLSMLRMESNSLFVHIQMFQHKMAGVAVCYYRITFFGIMFTFAAFASDNAHGKDKHCHYHVYCSFHVVYSLMLFYIYSCHFVHVVDFSNIANGFLQFFRRMYFKVHHCFHNTVFRFCHKSGDGEVLLFRDTIHHIIE